MPYIRTLHVALSLTTFLTSAPLMASPGEEMTPHQQPNKLTIRVAVDEEVAKRTIAAFATCCQQGDEEGALTLYEASDSLFNMNEYEFDVLAAYFYLNAIEGCEDPTRKAHVLHHGKTVITRLLASKPEDTTLLRMACRVANAGFENASFFELVNRLLAVGGDDISAGDFKLALLAAIGVGEHETAHRHWKTLVSQYPDSSHLTGNLCIVGTQCSFHTGHYADAIIAAKLTIARTHDVEIVQEAGKLVALSLINQKRPLEAAQLIEKCINKESRTCQENIWLADLFCQGGEHKKAMDCLKEINFNQPLSAPYFKNAIATYDAAIKKTSGLLRSLYTKQKGALLIKAKAQHPDIFAPQSPKGAKAAKSASISSDVASLIRRSVLSHCQREADAILQEISAIGNSEFASLKEPIWLAYKTIMACTPAAIEASPSSASTSSSSASPSLGLTSAQRALDLMRAQKGRLMHAFNLKESERRKEHGRATTSDASSAFESASSAPTPNLRKAVLEAHGLPLDFPKKQTDGNVTWDSPAASSAPVEVAAPFVPAPLSLHFLGGTSAKTFENIMALNHLGVTNENVRTLIEALAASSSFERATFKKNEGKGSHSKIRLIRTGTPKDQRLAALTLAQHDTLLDYSVRQLRDLFLACGLTK